MKKGSYASLGFIFIVVCCLALLLWEGAEESNEKRDVEFKKNNFDNGLHAQTSSEVNKDKSGAKRFTNKTQLKEKLLDKEGLYSEYSSKVRGLLLELNKPLTVEEERKYKKQVEEANNFAFSDYNIYQVESLKQLPESGDDYASRALVNRGSKEEAEKYAQRSIKAGHLMYSAIALRLILDKETRPKAYAYLLLGYKNGDMIAKKSIRVHLNSIPTTEEEFEEAIDYVPTLEQEVSEL